MNVRLSEAGGVATVTIDRSGGNRLDVATVEELTTILEGLQTRASPPDVVVLTGAGDDFSLGREPAGGPRTPGALIEEFSRIQRLNELVQRYPAVIVAKLRGRSHGAALSLAARCDFVIVSDNVRLSFPEVRHEIPPTIVLSHFRYVLPRPVLYDLILTGREIEGEEAVRVGIATRCVPDAELDGAVDALVAQVVGYGSRTLRTIKRFMATTDGMDPRDAPRYGISMITNEMVDRALDQP